jgi:hypothetical protein
MAPESARNLPAVVAPVAELAAWGDLAKKSGVVPPSTSREQAMAIVQTGSELGLQPFQSLRSMTFIGGRLTMSVQLQLALARRNGVRLETFTETGDACSVTLARGEEKITCTYSIDDARKAGLVKAGGAWDKYGRQMLRWRAIGDALRLIAPDLVMGLLDPIEAESIEPVPNGPEERRGDSPPADLPPAEAAQKQDPPAGAQAGPPPAEEPFPTDKISDDQNKKIMACFNELGITNRDSRLSWVRTCLHQPAINSVKDLDKQMASKLIDALEDTIAVEKAGKEKSA